LDSRGKLSGEFCWIYRKNDNTGEEEKTFHGAVGEDIILRRHDAV
jgi:hypothetical protein